MVRGFITGASFLAQGFRYWPRRPGLMALGLVPAAIVGAVLLAGLIALGVALPGITDAMTPFADGWPGLWASVVRIAVGTALLGAALVMMAVSFTALTLIIGEPFYARIWRSVEHDLSTEPNGGAAIDADYGFWRSVGDGVSLVARGVIGAVIALVIGLIPVVGSVLGTVFAVAFTGWLLADELSSRALIARGLDPAARRSIRHSHRARMLGFGVATQLCFMMPLGAVVTMPAAVAGSTALARTLRTSPRDEGLSGAGNALHFEG